MGSLASRISYTPVHFITIVLYLATIVSIRLPEKRKVVYGRIPMSPLNLCYR